MTRHSDAPLISVVVPTYNHGQFILDTIASVNRQTTEVPREIIVVNDGSPDDTAERLRPLRDAGEIIYLEQENRGQAAARNTGLSKARGQFIAFLDDDDLWPQDKLEWQLEFLLSNPDVGLVGGSVETFQADGPELRWEQPTVASQSHVTTIRCLDLFKGNAFWSPGQTMARTSLVRSIGGFDEGIWGADDLDFLFRLSRVTRVVRLDRLSLFYRLHQQNASKNIERMFHNCVSVLRKQLKEMPHEETALAYRRGYRWLYDYLGCTMVRQLKQRVIRSEVRAVIASLVALQSFLAPSLRDRYLRRAIWTDMVPARFCLNRARR